MPSPDLGLERFEFDLAAAPAKVRAAASLLLGSAAFEIKQAMNADFAHSPGFRRALAKSVTYDRLPSGGVVFEIGPDAERKPGAALAGIAYFGGAHGGGGTVPDPSTHLAAKAAITEQLVADVTERMLAG
jgi:hypothetical protein